jgi:acetylglutamate kinase
MRGEVNARVVAAGLALGLKPVGLCGADGGLLRVDRRPPWIVDEEAVDFGWVGDIQSVDVSVLRPLLDAGFLPVVAPIGTDTRGGLFNVNADTVSSAIASALGAARLLLVTESGAVRRSADGTGEALSECDETVFQAGIDAGWIRAGMRVKLEVGLEAARGGVSEVRIVGIADLGDPEAGTRVIA